MPVSPVSLISPAALISSPVGNVSGAEPDQLLTDIGGVAHMLNCSPATVRRRMQDTPDFRRSFKIHPKGEHRFVVQEIKAYVAAKAAMAQAA